MTDLLQSWIAESDENAKLFAEEGLILEATEAVYEAMEQRSISKAELAEALGRSKSYVTQALNGSRNMTLRTLANIAHALDMTVSIHLRPSLPDGHWEYADDFLNVKAPRHFFVDACDSINDQDWSAPVPLRKAAGS